VNLTHLLGFETSVHRRQSFYATRSKPTGNPETQDHLVQQVHLKQKNLPFSDSSVYPQKRYQRKTPFLSCTSSSDIAREDIAPEAFLEDA
jgi:hypothetical protein